MIHKTHGRTYMGMLGKTGPRAMIERAWEHYGAAAPSAPRITKELFCKPMQRLGRHDSVMIPLEVCWAHTIRGAEQYWMRRLGRVFNREQKYRGSKWATYYGFPHSKGVHSNPPKIGPFASDSASNFCKVGTFLCSPYSN